MLVLFLSMFRYRLSVSESLGNILYEHAHEKPRTAKKCLALAQKIFMDAEAHIPTMLCMLEQGRVTQAIEFGQKVNSLLSNE